MKRDFILCCALAFVLSAAAQTKDKDWAWMDFVRPAGVNPVMSPTVNSLFYCPMQGRAMLWEESDTFNPAATVLNGRVVLLYRAEDNSATGIGQRTSRIGYASSDDGLHFVQIKILISRYIVSTSCTECRIILDWMFTTASINTNLSNQE